MFGRLFLCIWVCGSCALRFGILLTADCVALCAVCSAWWFGCLLLLLFLLPVLQNHHWPMHYFAGQKTKSMPKAPTPSDTDLRSFATQYYASVFRDLGIPRASRLPAVRKLEEKFWEVSGRQNLWKLVWGRTELSDEDHFQGAFYRSYQINFVEEYTRRFLEEVVTAND